MTLRFGLLGTGYWAAETQASALAAHPDAELIGVWGRDLAKAEMVAGRFGARAYADVDALIADVDAVTVALPPDVQAELAVRAAEAGRHLLLDKPLGFTVAECDRVVAAVQHRDLASVIFFTNRFKAEVETFLAQVIQTGDWDGARVSMLASIFQPDNPYGLSPWRKERGGLWDIGPHALSILLPVLGPVQEVAAMDGPHSTVHLLLRHLGGAVSSVALTLDAPEGIAGQPSAYEFLFHGADGFAKVPSGTESPVEAFAVAVDDLIAQVTSGQRDHRCDVRFGREVVAILVAADEARSTGRSVTPDMS